MAIRIGFRDAVGSGRQSGGIIHKMEVEGLAYHQGVSQGLGRERLVEVRKIDLPREGGEGGNRPAPGSQGVRQVRDDRTGGIREGRLCDCGKEPPIVPSEGAFLVVQRMICHLRIVRTAKTLGEMTLVKKIAALCLLATSLSVVAQEAGVGEEFSYQPPVVEKSLFGAGLNMLNQERAEYATNLATFVAGHVNAKKASAESLRDAARVLGLAMHLSRQDRQTLIVNGQLRKGVLPEVKKGDYNPKTFARLLLSRARLLAREEDETALFLSRCFIEVAAMIDPRNEDAVFAYELQRIESGDVDWRLVTESAKDKPSQAPGS